MQLVHEYVEFVLILYLIVFLVEELALYLRVLCLPRGWVNQHYSYYDLDLLVLVVDLLEGIGQEHVDRYPNVCEPAARIEN